MFAAHSRAARPRRQHALVALLSLASGLVPVLAPWWASPAAAAPNTTQLISVATSGTQGTQDAGGGFSLSAGGRFVAFDSYATNLMAGMTDGNNGRDIFVRDRVANTTDLISIATTGGFGDGESADPDVSADGRYVAFTSWASNLVPGDTNGAADVFVRDRLTGTTERVSVSTAGAQGDQGGYGPRITPDGRYVVFGSDATNLVGGDTNGWTDAFLRDRVAGTTERISVSTGGAQGDYESGWPAVSADGRFVAFMSGASTLVAGDTNANWDIFVRDRNTNSTERVSVANSSGAQGDYGSGLPSISADGRYVVFYSVATNLVTGDTNGADDVFLRDRSAGTTQRISVGPGGVQGNGQSLDPNISRDGRYITYSSSANNLVANDTNAKQDEFVYDRLANTTELVSVSSASGLGDQNSAGRAAISADGRYVAFWSRATTLVTGDTNIKADIFVRERDPQQAPLVGSTAVGAQARRGGGSPSMMLDCPAPAADPCDVSTGNFSETVTDLSIPGRGMGLEFTRTYNSYPSPAAPADGPLGYGWSFNYGMSVTTGTDPTITEENGAQITFTGSGVGFYTPPARVIATLEKKGDNTWEFIRKAQEVYTFNASGQLASVRDRNGHTTTLSYVSGKLTTVTDPAGRTLTMGWTGSRITSVTDTASPARSVTFSYDGSGNLTEAVDIGGGHAQYGYDTNHRMTLMRSPNYFPDGALPSPVANCSAAGPTHTMANHYDGSGRIDCQYDPLGRKTSFAYTSNSTTVTDPKGNVRVDTFTAGLLTARTLGSGTAQAATWSYGHDPATLARTFTVDPNGGVTTTIHDGLGNALMTIDELGRTTVRTFNGLRQPVTVRDPMDVTTTYDYDTAGNLEEESTPLTGTSDIRTTTYTIETTTGREGDVLSVTDPDGKVWPRTWDSDGNLYTEADPLGHTSRYCYDTVGRKTKEISPKGTAASVTCSTANPTFTTLFSNDAFGEPLVVTNPLGDETVYSYDANRNRKTMTDPNGYTTTWVYDAANQLVEEIRPGGGGGGGSGIEVGGSTSDANAAPATTLVLDTPAGVAEDDVMVAAVAVRGVPTVTAPAGWTPIRSDSNGSSMKLLSYYRVAEDTEPADYTWSFSSSRAAAGTITAYSGVDTSDPADVDDGLPELNDTTSIVAPSVTTTEADERIIGLFAIMRATTITEPTGMTPRGHATSSGGSEPPVTIASADTTQTTLGATGTKTATAAVADRNTGQTIALNPAPSSGGGTTTLRYDYNDDSTLWKAFNGANEPTVYGYDSQARMTSVTDPLSRTTTYGYDPAGNRTTKQDPGGNCSTGSSCTTTRHDLAGQVTRIDYSDSGTPDVTLIDYDLNGRRTKMIDGTGTSTWTWDSLDRLTSTKNGNNQTVAYQYDLRGNNEKITYPGSTSVDRTFDNAGRLWKVKHWLSSTETVFTYDPNSFITKWAYPNGTTATYNPDDASRIDSISHALNGSPPVPFATFDYERDAVGQITSVTSTGVPADDHTFTYNPLGQLATDGTDPYSYDPADNITGLPNGATLTYDNANQLDTMTVSGSTTSYGFDTRGNRTSITPLGGPSTTIGYDQANRLKTYGGDASYAYNGDGLRMSKTVSSVTSQVTWDHTESQPLLLVDGTVRYVYGPGGLPLAQINGSNGTYYYHDQFGSTRVLKDSAAATLATYSYDRQGNVTGSTGSISNPFRFAGQYTDTESGYLALRDGYYDPATATNLSVNVAETRPQNKNDLPPCPEPGRYASLYSGYGTKLTIECKSPRVYDIKGEAAPSERWRVKDTWIEAAGNYPNGKNYYDRTPRASQKNENRASRGGYNVWWNHLGTPKGGLKSGSELLFAIVQEYEKEGYRQQAGIAVKGETFVWGCRVP